MSDVSVVIAIAGSARRFFKYRTTYSVARCCASAALPPFPQKNSVPPPFTTSRIIVAARSTSAPRWSAAAMAVAASSRSRCETCSFIVSLSSSSQQQFSQAAEHTAAERQRRYGNQRLVGDHPGSIGVGQQLCVLYRAHLFEPDARRGQRSPITMIVTGEAINETVREHGFRQLRHRASREQHRRVGLNDGA